MKMIMNEMDEIRWMNDDNDEWWWYNDERI